MQMARLVSSWSKDPNTKVGAVVVRPRGTVLSVGFNGFPRGIKDDKRLHDRLLKHQIVVRAEENCLLCTPESVEGCTVYVWPIIPCPRCAAKLIQSRVARVVAPATKRETCGDMTMNLTRKLLKEAHLQLDEL